MYKSGLMELEAVVAVARLGSFRAAALELEMSPTAIGNAVAGLESRLGVRLFNRTTRNVALTSAGREYVDAIAPALLDIRNATQAVAVHSSKPTGTLRFSCSLPGGRHLLAPFVFEYLRRYDEVKVEIVTEGRLIDIIKDGFDAGVRHAEAVPQDMIAMPLGPHTRHVVVGAPSYFANRPRPIVPADLMDHECIRARHASPHFSHNYAFVVFDGTDLRADRVGGLGDACGPTKGQAEAVPSFDDVCGGQPSVYALSGSCSGRGVAEANVSEAEFDLVGKG